MHRLVESEYRRVTGDLDLMDPQNGVFLAHVHSASSDGLLSSHEIARKAYEKGVTALGLADHDTANGYVSLYGTNHLQHVLMEEVTTKELDGQELHLGAVLKHEITVPYGVPYRETIRMINQVGHAFVPHISMDRHSLTWQQVEEQNSSPDPLDHIRLVETTNGGDLKKTEKVKRNRLWGVIFKRSGSSQRARDHAATHKERLGVEEIGSPDAHYTRDLFDVIMVFPRTLHPIDAMLSGETAVFERVKQSKISVREFFRQRSAARRLERLRRRGEIGLSEKANYC